MTETVETFSVATVKCACGVRTTFRFCYLDNWECVCTACRATLRHPKPPSSVSDIDRDRAALRDFIANVRVKHQRFHGNRRFSGAESRSVSKGFHPREVRFIKSKMPKSQHCISEKGDVSFSDRREEQMFNAEFEAMAQGLGGFNGTDDPTYANDVVAGEGE